MIIVHSKHRTRGREVQKLKQDIHWIEPIQYWIDYYLGSDQTTEWINYDYTQRNISYDSTKSIQCRLKK